MSHITEAQIDAYKFAYNRSRDDQFRTGYTSNEEMSRIATRAGLRAAFSAGRLYSLEKSFRSLIDCIANSSDEQMTPTMRDLLVSAGRSALRDGGGE